jgi:hypothetical protein
VERGRSPAARRRALAALAVAGVAGVAVLLLLLLAGGDAPERAAPPARPAAPPPREPPQRGLAVGLTEMNPALVWSAASEADVGPFAPWRETVAAMRPRYLRVLVDWAQLQPDPARGPDLERAADGCARGQPPCRPSRGLRELLRAARSQQRDGGGFEVVLVLYGVPAWAAAPPSGCERPETEPRSRPISARGLRGYRALVRALVALGRDEGVALRWWSAWNEPNGPFFLSPQRPRCAADAPPRAPAVYARLFRALGAELRRAGGDRRLLLGDVADVVRPSAAAAAAGELVDGLPDDVVCAADAVAVHDYAERGEGGRPDVVAQVRAALARRPCAARAPIWVTETGVGDAHAGGRRTGGAAARRADCRALHAALRRWWRDPRVDVAFQYTLRDDPEFPVGLADARLQRRWPTADLLAAWGGDRDPAARPPRLPAACEG